MKPFAVFSSICTCSLIAVSAAGAATVYSDTFSDPGTVSQVGTTLADAAGSYSVGTEGATNTAFSVSGGTLNETRSDNAGYRSTDILTNNAVTAGLTNFTTSADLINIGGGGRQPGLVIAGDNSLGGFVLQENDAVNSHFTLQRETGGQLLSDEGGGGNPPVLHDFGALTPGDTYHIAANVDRTGANPVITISITDLTAGTTFASGVVTTDTSDPASYGGNSVGFRVRDNSGGAITQSFDNLLVTTAVPEPSTWLAAGGLVLLAASDFRRRLKA